MQRGRYLGLIAGPYRVALPIVAVRQILDAGGGGAPTDPRALGVEPIALASVLGAQPTAARQALLLFDGHPGPVLLTADGLMGVLEPAEVSPLPLTVATRWPGLVQGALRHDGLVLILDPQVLVGLVEVWDRDQAAPPAAVAPTEDRPAAAVWVPAEDEAAPDPPKLAEAGAPGAEPFDQEGAAAAGADLSDQEAPVSPESAPAALTTEDPFDQGNADGPDPFDQGKADGPDPFDQRSAEGADPFDQAAFVDDGASASAPPRPEPAPTEQEATAQAATSQEAIVREAMADPFDQQAITGAHPLNPPSMAVGASAERAPTSMSGDPASTDAAFADAASRGAQSKGAQSKGAQSKGAQSKGAQSNDVESREARSGDGALGDGAPGDGAPGAAVPTGVVSTDDSGGEPTTGLTALEALLTPMMLPRRPSAEAGRPGQGKNSQVLLFRAAGARFGVFIAEVGRLVVEHDVAPVPFAHPALAGLLDDASEQVVPVFDQMGLMGQHPRPRVEGARVALFETDGGPVGLRLDVMEGGGLHYTFLTDKEATEARLGELPPELRAAVTAVGEDDGGPFFFFSADAFLAALDLGAPRRPT